MLTIQNRLREFINYLQIPMQTFERQCNIGQGLASKITENSYPMTFNKISKAYPELNIKWLLSGEGEMLNPPEPLTPSEEGEQTGAQTINDRIAIIIEDKFRGNKSAFAKALGLPPALMSSYFGKQRRSKPGIDLVANIVRVLNVDARWLLIGVHEKQGGVYNAPTAINGGVAAMGNATHINTFNPEEHDELIRLRERVKLLEEKCAESSKLVEYLIVSRDDTRGEGRK